MACDVFDQGGALGMKRRMRALAEKLDSPHADKVFVAKEFTNRDLINELVAIAADAAPTVTGTQSPSIKQPEAFAQEPFALDRSS